MPPGRPRTLHALSDLVTDYQTWLADRGISSATVRSYGAAVNRALSQLEEKVLDSAVSQEDIAAYRGTLTKSMQTQFVSAWNELSDFLTERPRVPHIAVPRTGRGVGATVALGAKHPVAIPLGMLIEYLGIDLADAAKLTLGALVQTLDRTDVPQPLRAACLAIAQWAWGADYRTRPTTAPALPMAVKSRSAMMPSDLKALLMRDGLTLTRLRRGYFFNRHSIALPDGTVEVTTSYEVDRRRARGEQFEDLGDQPDERAIVVPPRTGNQAVDAAALESGRTALAAWSTGRQPVTFSPTEGLRLAAAAPTDAPKVWHDPNNPMTTVDAKRVYARLFPQRDDAAEHRAITRRDGWDSDYNPDWQPKWMPFQPGDIVAVVPEWDGKLGEHGLNPPLLPAGALYEFRYSRPYDHPERYCAVLRLGDNFAATFYIKELVLVAKATPARAALVKEHIGRARRNQLLAPHDLSKATAWAAGTSPKFGCPCNVPDLDVLAPSPIILAERRINESDGTNTVPRSEQLPLEFDPALEFDPEAPTV